MRTRWGFDRLITFADAVVAIAMTLLVLPLVDIPGESKGLTVEQVVQHNGSQLGAFALSFLVIARLWTVHHHIFERCVTYDGVLMQVTLVWLLTVVFLPFPTALLGETTRRATMALYIGTLLVSALALSVSTAWIFTHPKLQRTTDDDGRYWPPERSHWSTSALLAVALVIAVGFPTIGMWALLLLFLSGPIDAWTDRRLKTEPAPSPPPDAKA